MQHLKLHDNRGESLIEVLASILVVSLSVMLLAGSIMASSKEDVQAGKFDAKHYDALSDAETQETATEHELEVTITSDVVGSTGKLFKIKTYGGEEMFSYERGDW